MNNEELLKAILRQTTNNIPKLYIKDAVSGRVFEYGKNCHDKLVISEDGRCLTYYNLQDGDGSCVGDYRFFYEKPKLETEEEKQNAYDIEHWARMVENQSISELLAEERKKVVSEIRDLAGDYWTIPLKKYVDYDGNEIKALLTMKDFDEILDQIQEQYDI